MYITDVQKVIFISEPKYMHMYVCIRHHKPIYSYMPILAQFYKNYYCKKLNAVNKLE